MPNEGQSNSPGVATTKAPAEEALFASICPGGDKPLPKNLEPFAKAVLKYEQETKRPALVIFHKDVSTSDDDDVSNELAERIIESKKQINPSGEDRVSLILHTPGGNPHSAYRIGVFLQKLGGFEVLIPKMAKSAGTLMTLGAAKMIMGEMAELGPLDMQVKDPETELWDSALNETKALQTLSREALLLYFSKMELLESLYEQKSFHTRNEIATEFVNEMIRPMVEKINAVHYTKMARIMEIMKAYGKQLMSRSGYAPRKTVTIVDALGENYPDHGYIIDSREARMLGLKVEVAKDTAAQLFESILPFCGRFTIIGRISTIQTSTNQAS